MNAIHNNADPKKHLNIAKKGKTVRDEPPEILKHLAAGPFEYLSSHKYA